MYESDEWYVQYGSTTNKKAKVTERLVQNLPETEEQWDLNSSASDNESYAIEVEQQEGMEE